MFSGVLNWSWWQVLLITLGMTHITIAAVTIYLHRSQAHRALDLHPVVAHGLRFWLWLTTGMNTREWVAVHRKHHARCETREDPHSPQVLGLAKVLWQGTELYQAATADKAILERFGHGTPDDWIERKLYRPHKNLGILLMFLIDLGLFGPIGITVWAVQMIWVPFFAAGVINGIGHYWGYRNFDSPDAATNILPWGILIGGEELHNNHHAFPSSAKLSSKPWEFDLGWFYIRGLVALGLAKVRKISPSLAVVSGKDRIDMDTLRAVILNRMNVLARYVHEVWMPVSKSELCQSPESCRRLYRQVRKILLQGEFRMTERSRLQLQRVLQESQSLRTVYQYRDRLKDVWEKTASSQDILLQSLQDWCRQAESSGIKALQDFARDLRSYAVQPSAM